MLFLSPGLIFFSLSFKQSVVTSESERNVIKYLPEVRGKENSEGAAFVLGDVDNWCECSRQREQETKLISCLFGLCASRVV